MAPPEAHWMLWAKRLKDEHKILLHRIDSATQQITDLAAGPKDLQAENNALKERIMRLEEDAVDKKQGMLRLEKDVADQKQKIMIPDEDSANREQVLGSEIHKLKERITELEKELSRTVEIVGNWQEPARILREEEERLQLERPRAQSHGSVAVTSMNSNHRTGTGMPLNLSHLPYPERGVRILTTPTPASKAPSQATTATDPGVLIPSAELSPPRTRSQDSIGIASQGAESLEEYLEYGDESVMRAVQLYETRAVKAFVSGIREKSRQSRLWEILTEQGWTWQNARVGMRMLLDDRRKRRR